MILDYENILKMIDGTPLAGLTKSQIEDNLIGSFPIALGSVQFSQKWSKINQDDYIKEQLRVLPFKDLLNSLTLRLLKQKRENSNLKIKEKLDLISDFYEYLKENQNQKTDLLAAKEMISDQNLALVRYEKLMREKDLEIKGLNQLVDKLMNE